MENIIKLLDENLAFIDYKLVEDTLYISVKSKTMEAVCPYCGEVSSRVHSHYPKSFQDLPVQGKKVIILLDNRKMFCNNPECSHTTFAETFSFIEPKSKKTRRLKEQIVSLSKNLSSVNAEKYCRENVVRIGKSTICELLKKSTFR